MKKRIIDFIRQAMSYNDVAPSVRQEGFDIAMVLQNTGIDYAMIGHNYVCLNGFQMCITDYMEAYFLLNRGEKIQAIKKLRSVIPNLGLKEAKDMTEVASLFPNAHIYREHY